MFVYLFILREREREIGKGAEREKEIGKGAEREGERESQTGSVRQCRAWHGAGSHEPGDHDLSRDQESDI